MVLEYGRLLPKDGELITLSHNMDIFQAVDVVELAIYNALLELPTCGALKPACTYP